MKKKYFEPEIEMFDLSMIMTSGYGGDVVSQMSGGTEEGEDADP